jgi:hypothetical protein
LECGENRRFGFFVFGLPAGQKEKSKAAMLAALQIAR